ncbi:MAG: selenium cofactor biosynthesis protein YqeC [Defluviitaleaceae bacterium]|nr:selenium cofactor biosynthesis protein YqeC [Defluviitaleaceae bacterium]
MTIIEKLALDFPCIVAVVGCGGKTSFIMRMAESLPDKKILISPTTKIFPINAGNADCVGVLNAKTGKLAALPEDELADLVPQYSIVLLEADGSRSLPCKGWRANEPVVPSYCTHTIGIVTMNALGKPATEKYVLNLELFLALTGLRENEIITSEALKTMVCAPEGMFKNSMGKKILLVNQVESPSSADDARKFLLSIKEDFPGFFEKLMFGSIHFDTWNEV